MKKGLINMIAMVLTLVNLILTGLLVFAIVPAMQSTNSVVTKIGEIIDLDAVTKVSGDENSGDSVDTSLDEELAMMGTCQHTVEFFANPELAAQVIEMQRQQLIALGLIQAPIIIDNITGGDTGDDGTTPAPDPLP